MFEFAAKSDDMMQFRIENYDGEVSYIETTYSDGAVAHIKRFIKDRKVALMVKLRK